ncbi:hypothetical protein OAN21_01950 [Alphaproteobacteria bacterium]|nr:hypothetical protein [Alphaproteobacteria bacterium]
MIKNILFFTFFSFVFLGQASLESAIVVEKASTYRLQSRGGGGFECPEKRKKSKPSFRKKKEKGLNKKERKEQRSKKKRSHSCSSIGGQTRLAHGRDLRGR